MKQYSPNSNIIITTYSCIYLYIQHVGLSKIASPFGHSQSTPLIGTQVLTCGAHTFGWGITFESSKMCENTRAIYTPKLKLQLNRFYSNFY